MIRLLVRAPLAAVLGALAGAACLIAAFTFRPAIAIEMDKALPPGVASGIYSPERAGEVTFAWTSRRADINLAGLDRRAPWSCSLRFSGEARDPGAQPMVEFVVDGVTLARQAATHEYQDLVVTIPPRSTKPGLNLTIASSTTFVPASSDTRELGIQIDRVVCQPAASVIALPPRRAIRAAAAATAAFGAAAALAGLAVGSAAGAVLLIALGQALLLATGLAAYGAYPKTMVTFAVWIAASSLASIKLLERWSGHTLSRPAIFVVCFSTAALYLKLLGLLHPSKLLIDALFHAHRLEWVLAGRYYFTQPMPSGVSFPYAIGLYLFATPWTLLTNDYITLLRVLVCAAEVVAGALLYVMIVRTWGDRIVAALAVVFFNVVPLPFMLVGNANLANAFGQSIALMTLVAAATLQFGPRRFVAVIVLFLLSSLAFLSHVSTFSLLFVALLSAAFFTWWLGREEHRWAARTILLVTLLAAVFSVVTYYGHFDEVYRTALRARASAVTARGGARAETTDAGSEPGTAATTKVSSRIGEAMTLTVSAIGWSTLILAGAGLWSVWSGGTRDRLVFVLAGWGVAYVVFFAAGVLAPVEPRLERYAAEFVSRVNFATYPAAAILAARGGVWAWRAGLLPRIVSFVLLFTSVVNGVRHWMAWFA